MVGALFLVVRQKLFLSQTYHDQVAALYLAELAIQDARAELENDPDWTTGFTNKSVPGVRGTYNVGFNTTGAPFTNMESVNNANGIQGGETYRGPATLDRGDCLLVATAEVGRSTRTIEALVQVGGGLPFLDVALLNDRRIVLTGDVKIEGVKSLRDSTPVLVGLHSNLATGADDIVDLSGVDAASNITGVISSSGTSPNAVNLGLYGATHTGGQANNAPQKTFPNVDIVGRVSSKSSSPPPVITPGTTVLNFQDEKEYFHSGPLFINGDLKLEGVNLYVDGPLTINGSLEGNGSVFVTGKSILQGSTKVTTATPDKIALFSHGSVQIAGFNGTDYLQNQLFPSSAAANLSFQNLRADLFSFNNDLANFPFWGPGGVLDVTRSRIAGETGTPVGPGNPSTFMLNRLIYFLQNEAPSTARDSLLKKFISTRDMLQGALDGSASAQKALDQAKAGRFGRHSIDAILDTRATEYYDQISGLLATIDLNRPGEAYFQGLVYTHGFLHASAEVTIVGAIAVTQSSTGPPIPNETIGPHNLSAGDVYLLDGSKLLFVEEFFKNREVHAGPGGEGTKVLLWMGR